jgi:hypothetical protein
MEQRLENCLEHWHELPAKAKLKTAAGCLGFFLAGLVGVVAIFGGLTLFSSALLEVL